MKMKSKEVINYLNELIPDAKCELDFNNGYQLLIAVILSAQTTDASVNRVTKELFRKYKNFEELSKAKVNDVKKIIKTIGLANIKAKRIIDVSKIIHNEYKDKIPDTIEELTSINGIGRKTANVILVEHFKKQAFPVDTHIHRLAIRFGVAKKDDSLLEVEKKMVKFFNTADFRKLHHQLILFGRYYCKAIKPDCKNCKLKCNNSLSQK